MPNDDQVRLRQGAKMNVSRRIGVVLLLVSPVAVVGGSGAPGPDAEASVEQGRALYEVYCQGCHGVEADGKGPMAESLGRRPPDLTRLQAAKDKSFPVEEVHRAIDGRQSAPGHLRRDMPIWGLTFQELDRDTDQERDVRDKITSLIRYLESIQNNRD